MPIEPLRVLKGRPRRRSAKYIAQIGSLVA
jgi:hypothetical protein